MKEWYYNSDNIPISANDITRKNFKQSSIRYQTKAADISIDKKDKEWEESV